MKKYLGIFLATACVTVLFSGCHRWHCQNDKKVVTIQACCGDSPVKK